MDVGRTIDIIEYNSDFKRKFNIRVESSESKRGIYYIVEDMIVSLLDRVDPLLHHIKYMKHDDSARSNCDEQEIDSTYRNLEKLLQKYEADIRKHIGVQHTMKIYSESISEKLDEKEKMIDQLNHKLRVKLKV